MSAKIARALLSVSNKACIVEFAQALVAMGIELLSTGGTASSLRAAGVNVRDVSELTGFPEIMDGRVKTLHPKVHGGLLKRRGNLKHEAEATTNGIGEIDLLVVNLYPFEETVVKPGCTFADAIEQIDIGGPAMLRSAAKNSEFVTVVCDPGDYASVLVELRANSGNTLLATRMELAAKVFAMTSRYDAAICRYLEVEGQAGPPATFALHATLKQALRYGENSHQKDTALYALPSDEPCAANGRKASGKEMGYNNLMDMDAAFEVVKEFPRPAACIVKHRNPCGVAVADSLLAAYQAAYAGDPVSAFGGVLGLNGILDERIAEAMLAVKGFKLDAIVVLAIVPGALEILTTKKKWGKEVIVVETGGPTGADGILSLGKRAIWRDARTIPGGVLTQSCDRLTQEEEFANLKTVTKREPTAEEIEALKFAWVVCKHVKSNAIVLGRGNTIVGVGAGQMSRVDSVEISIKKAGDRARGAVLASDAFFPFPDGPEAAARAGVTAIIQPGGSQKDSETIAVCDKYGIAMAFTGIRHFRH